MESSHYFQFYSEPELEYLLDQTDALEITCVRQSRKQKKKKKRKKKPL